EQRISGVIARNAVRIVDGDDGDTACAHVGEYGVSRSVRSDIDARLSCRAPIDAQADANVARLRARIANRRDKRLAFGANRSDGEIRRQWTDVRGLDTDSFGDRRSVACVPSARLQVGDDHDVSRSPPKQL